MAKLTDAEFISAWERCGGASTMAKELGMDKRSLYPANWQRILDVCRQEVAGDSAAAPYLFWGLHND